MPRRSHLALIAALFATSCTAAPDQPAKVAGIVEIEKTSDAVFGLSGIELSDDGMTFVAIGDRGQIIEGEIVRSPAGDPLSVSITRTASLRAPDGAEIYGTELADSEGLTLLPDGSYAVSFEGEHRVNLYPAIDGPAVTIQSPRDFNAFGTNASLEAIASDEAGNIYVMPERSGRLTDDFPVFRHRDGAWDMPFRIPRTDGYLPVGADFGPDGQLYVLERRFLGLLGFSTRVRRFDIEGDRISGGGVVVLTPPGLHDNLEGLSVWRDGAGEIRLTMVSDDNNLPVQTTELVEYRLIE